MATLKHYVTGGFYVTNAYPFMAPNADGDADDRAQLRREGTIQSTE